MNPHVLVTGAGAPGAAGIFSCLKQDASLRITMADADEEASGRYLCDHFIRIPRGDDPDFISEMEKVCSQQKITAILPLVTRELLPLSRRATNFKKLGVSLPISNPNAISKANNKAATYLFLSEAGIKVPAFHVVNTVEDFIHGAFEIGHPRRPFVFKPAESNGSRGVRIVSDAIDEADILFNRKPYHLHITYAHALSILSSHPFPQLLITEFMEGQEYSVDCLANHGSPVLVLPRTRERMINGISVKGRFENNQEIIVYCSSIIEALALHGNVGMQLKLDNTGAPLLLEINPRLQGTTVAAMGAGVNFPLLALYQEWGMETSIPNIQWNTGFSRHWSEVFY